MRTLITGDLHGHHAALLQCLERSNFNNQTDQLIQLGDVVDGGAEIFECVETLLNIKNLVAIKGNHDEWFLEWMKTGYHPVSWAYGGKSTLMSYAKRVGKQHLIKTSGEACKSPINAEHIPASHRQFFERQQLYHIDSNNNLFVHAGFNRHQGFFNQRKENYYWDRDLWTAALQWQVNSKHFTQPEPFHIETNFRKIFIGHTPTMNWRIDKPMQAANIINLDTGGKGGGKLTIMDTETTEFWQSDTELPLSSPKLKCKPID